MNMQIIISTVVGLVVAVAVVHLIRAAIESQNDSSSQTQQSTPPDQLHEEKKRQKRLVAMGIMLLMFFGLIGFTLARRTSGEGSSDSDSALVSVIPIWVVVMLPFIVSRNKRRKDGETASEKQRAIIIAMVLGLLILVGAVVAILYVKS